MAQVRAKRIPFNVIADLGYYKFAKGTCAGIRGYFYWMERELSDGMRALVESYGNTRCMIGSCGYAPEIKRRVVFVGDKCFPKSARA